MARTSIIVSILIWVWCTIFDC